MTISRTGLVMLLAFLLLPFAMGQSCNGSGDTRPAVYFLSDPKGDASGSVGLVQYTTTRPSNWINVMFNTQIVDAHPSWRVAWDRIGTDGAKVQVPPAGGFTEVRQSASDSGYYYKGPSIWSVTLLQPSDAGELVTLYAPRIECIAPPCTGAIPRITIHWIQDSVTELARWFRPFPMGSPECDVESPPDFPHTQCIRRRADAFSTYFRTWTLRLADAQNCLNCHEDNFVVLPGAQ